MGETCSIHKAVETYNSSQKAWKEDMFPESTSGQGDTGCENVRWINLKSFLGYNAVQPNASQQTFWKHISPPFSESKNNTLLFCIVYSSTLKIEVTIFIFYLFGL
jgi:hypothetical protein